MRQDLATTDPFLGPRRVPATTVTARDLTPQVGFGFRGGLGAMARRPFISRVAISAAIPLLATFFSALSLSCLGDDTTAAPGQSMAGSGASGSTASSTGAGGAPSGTGGEAGSTVGDGGSAPEDAGMTVDGAGGTGGEPNFDAGPIANPGLWDLVGIARI